MNKRSLLLLSEIIRETAWGETPQIVGSSFIFYLINMKNKIILSLLSIILLVACAEKHQNNVSDVASSSQTTLAQKESWELQAIKRQWQTENCNQADQPCFEITLIYPQLANTTASNRVKINEAIEEKVVNLFSNYYLSAETETQQLNLDQIVQDQFDEFLALVEDNSVFASNWTIELKGEKSAETATTLTVSLAEYYYTGGAHPNSYQSYLNFKKETGELIQLATIIADQDVFLKIAEQHFRKAYDLTADQDLTAAGLFENQFVLPENFAITEKGLLLFYNTYEIAPYVAGTYEFQIPWDELDAALNLQF